MGLIVGVDASRNRSGGAKAHLRGILSEADPREHEISEVHVWAYKDLLHDVADAPWLVKHTPAELDGSLLRQVWWQAWHLPRAARQNGCDIVFTTDAGTVSDFGPAVVMSQDMLSYEPLEMKRFGLSAGRLRLILLRYLQSRAMRRADGVIFLTNYAAETIQRTIGPRPRHRVIPLGVGNEFRRDISVRARLREPAPPIRCVYVSNALMYKHQWTVVRAIGELRGRGHNLSLLLAGGGSGRAQRLLDNEIARSDPGGEFVRQVGFVAHGEIPALLADADVFIFASSCENMPVTLVEAMANGLPIACSDRGPMPEILQDAGVYFDPESPASIAAAVERIVANADERTLLAQRARTFADRYSWARCGHETWSFIHDVVAARRSTA